jgi:hypothetical protein
MGVKLPLGLSYSVHNRKGAKTPSSAKEIRKLALQPKEESLILCNALSLRIFAPSRLCGSLFLDL